MGGGMLLREHTPVGTRENTETVSAVETVVSEWKL